MSCIPNSLCHQSNGTSVCTCAKNFKPNINSMCSLNMNETCSLSNDLCDPEQYLTCGLDLRCACEEGSELDPISGSCLLSLGSPCSPDPSTQVCVPSSHCSLSAIDREFRCSCPGETVEDSIDGRCYLPYAANCDVSDDLCNPHELLACAEKDSSCRCNKLGNKIIFHTETQKCWQMAGSSCEPEHDKCLPNSKCLLDATAYDCTCDFPLHPNMHDMCYLGFNESCSRLNDLCDPAGFLSCGLEHRCRCKEGEDAWFNDNLGTCTTLVRSPCDNNPIVSPKNLWDYRSTCVPNAICLDGVCQCDKGSTERDRHCYLQHGQHCSHIQDICDPNSFLECDQTPHHHRCICQNQNRTMYHGLLKTCFLLPGNKCRNESIPCRPNSFCHSVTGTCTCNSPLVPNHFGFCQLGYGKACNGENDLCDPASFLQCADGQCICARDHETNYDVDSGSCRIIAGRTCSKEAGAQACVPRADCRKAAGADYLRCTCRDPFSSNKDRLCYSKYNESCSQEVNFCDPNGFLGCGDEGHCTCQKPAQMEYDFEENACYTEVNQPCSVSKDSSPCTALSSCVDGKCSCNPMYEPTTYGSCALEYGAACFEEGNCNAESHLTCLDNVCLCDQGFLEREESESKLNRTICMVNYDFPCSDIEPCNDLAFLQCLNGTCLCTNSIEQVFDGRLRKCVGLEGGSCNEVNQVCGGNSTCFYEDYGTTGHCRCAEGFRSDEEHICAIASGGTSNISVLEEKYMVFYLMFKVLVIRWF